MLICLATKNESAFAGEIEVDENYLVDRGKANVAEVRKVYTKVIADTKAKTMMGIMQK